MDVRDLNVSGQSPRHNMWLLQYTDYIEDYYLILIVITHIMMNKFSVFYGKNNLYKGARFQSQFLFLMEKFILMPK